jgi:hypothetical protein
MERERVAGAYVNYDVIDNGGGGGFDSHGWEFSDGRADRL